MSLSTPFIARPIGTTLLTIAVGMAGVIAYLFLPVSALPQVDFPTIQVNATLPGASSDTMASSVATPLERQFGRIAGITDDLDQPDGLHAGHDPVRSQPEHRRGRPRR